jgi:hypothetical protein
MSALLLVLLTMGASPFPYIEYDPGIEELMYSVSADTLAMLIKGLSGEIPVIIEGEPDSLPCRFAASTGALRAALWIREQLQTRGVQADTCSFIPVSLVDAVLLSDGQGFACGNALEWNELRNGLFYTPDQGASWQKVPEQGIDRLTALAAFSTDSIWLISERRRIIRTVDGSTWQVMAYNGSPLYDLAWMDNLHGWAVGDSGTVARTDDAWETFQEYHQVDADLRFADFISPQEGWIASYENLWLTSDGGENLTPLLHPLKQITAVEFVDSLTGFITGETTTGHGGVFMTSDGGASWTVLTDTFSRVPRTICVTDTSLWIAGDGGMIAVSVDTGTSWEMMFTPNQARINALAFDLSGAGVAVGFEDIFCSPDGLTWQRPDTANLGLMWNVVGEIAGIDSAQVIATAHYDARSEDFLSYTPGADDNATGVAALIEMARLLGEDQRKHTLRLAFFSGEETGILGSQRYVTERAGTSDSIMAVINVDMVGYDGDCDRVADVNSNPADPFSPTAGKIFTDVVDIYGLDIIPHHHITDARHNSDHRRFWEEEIPAIFVGEHRDDVNPFYHQTGDRISRMDMDYYTEIVRAATGWMAHLAELDELEGATDAPKINDKVLIELSSPVIRDRGWIRISAPGQVVPVIYDACGRKVKQLNRIEDCSTVMIPLDASDLPQGVYWISVKTDKTSAAGKFTVIR